MEMYLADTANLSPALYYSKAHRAQLLRSNSLATESELKHQQVELETGVIPSSPD